MRLKLEKVAIIGFILNGLPDSYRFFVVNLESQMQTINYEDLPARLMDEEKCIIGTGVLKSESQSDELDSAIAHLASRTRGSCYSCGKRGHNAAQSPEKENFQCEWCGRFGHDEENCRTKEYQRNKSEKSKKHRNMYAALGVVDDYFTVPGY
jgi:hypothetical protein